MRCRCFRSELGHKCRCKSVWNGLLLLYHLESRCRHFVNVLKKTSLTIANKFGWIEQHDWGLVREPGGYRFSYFWYRLLLGKSGGNCSRSSGSLRSGGLRNDRPDWDLTGLVGWPPGSLTSQKSGSFCSRILENEKYAELKPSKIVLVVTIDL